MKDWGKNYLWAATVLPNPNAFLNALYELFKYVFCDIKKLQQYVPNVTVLEHLTQL